MDSPIYQLLARAEQEKNVEFLKEAYYKLDPEVSLDNEESSIDVENFSQSLFVECAEKAINFNEYQIANRCIEIYFSLTTISNQFLARAYLCQFEILAPKSSFEISNLNKAIPFLHKAIDFSMQNKRYHFLVYNSSLIFWKYARSFIKAKFKRLLCSSLKLITQSLRSIDDPDHEWRAFLEKILIEAYLDNDQRSEASSLASDLLKFVEKHQTDQLEEYFELIMNKNLIDDEELKNLSANYSELDIIYRIELLKRPTKKKHSIDNNEIQKELSELYQTLLPKNKAFLDSRRKSEFMTRESIKTKNDSKNSQKRQRLLLKLAHVCLIFEEVNICSRIVGYLKENENLTEENLFEIELIECEQTIKQLKHKQEKFNKNMVRLRTECINKCHETLRNIFRTQNFHLIQLGCTKQWNFCLPLLQPGLRTNVRRPLQFVAECLEEIESMEWLLRCQIHFELAKCDEEIEQLQTAEQHLLKALNFDDEKIYKEQLEHTLKRLRLRAELYFPPERVEDQVAMILEQCVIGDKSKQKVLKYAISELLESLNAKINEKPQEINTRSLLLRAGDLLASEFTHVLESETFKSFGKLNEDQVTILCKKMLNYENCVKKSDDHLKDRIEGFVRNFLRNNPNSSKDNPEIELNIKLDYKERLKLWYDLCRIARKQQIWDICRVSCRFCLLYDDEQLKLRFLKTSGKFNTLFDIELLRNLAEAHFIFGESLVQYIRGEGIELYQKPNPPVSHDSSVYKIAKLVDQSESEIDQTKSNTNKRDFENDQEWNKYTNWLNNLSKEAVKNFLQGIKIGIELQESWIVCQGSAYLWNYFHHLIDKRQSSQILSVLTEMFDAIKKIGHDTEAELLVSISIGLSSGLMQNWLPPDQMKPLQIPVVTEISQDKRKQIVNVQTKPIVIPPEAGTDFKKALDVCEYAMMVTNGDDLKDVVGLGVRSPLIKNWVLAKQFTQSTIKNFGLSKNNEKIQDKYTKCMVGIGILNRNLKVFGQSSYEIKEPPGIKEMIGFMDSAQPWPDKLIELELWSNLCILAYKGNQIDNLKYCNSRALQLVSYFEKKKTENKNIYLKSQFLLSQACLALGEHFSFILNNPNTSPIASSSKQNLDQSQNVNASNSSKDIRIALRRNALNGFADAAIYAANSENYELVVHAARHYWNLCLPYLAQPQERATLYENLTEILYSWTSVYKFKPKEIINNIESEKAEEMIEMVQTKSAKSFKSTKSNKENILAETEKKPENFEDAFDDLTLRCVLYACLFQISLDKNQFEEALEQMETALNDLPRTKHRLLVYRFKVITKAKLGMDVQMDLQKFREENEKNLAQMYRKVALSSIKNSDTIKSYQRAIETLSSDESVWLKFEYSLELAQILFSNEFSLENCIDLAEWALDLLMFKIKSDKSRSASVAISSSLSKPNSKGKITTKATNSAMSILPTIHDNVEIKSFHKKMDANSELEYDSLINANLKDVLFESNSIEWNNPLTWTDLQDIKQLDCFIRTNVILAKMVGQNNNEYSGYLLKSYYSVYRLICLAVENAQNTIKEIQKLGQTEGTQVDKKKVPDSKKPLETKSKKKNDTNVNLIPQNQEQWSQFDLNEEILTSWNHDLMKKTGINKNSISEPYLLFYYLDKLVEMLRNYGWSHLIFPVHYLQLFLVNSALKMENKSQVISLNIYLRLRMINLCAEMNLIQAIGFHQQALAKLVLKPTTDISAQVAHPNASIFLKLIQIDALEACLSRDEIYSFKQRLTQLEHEDTNFKSNSFASFSSSSKKGFSTNSLILNKNKIKKKQIANKNQNVKISDNNSTDQNTTNIRQYDPSDLELPGEMKKIDNNFYNILYKDVWIILAEYLIENGYFQVARDYLYEALNASITFEDNKTLGKIQYMLGKIALFDHDLIEARNYAANAQKTAIDEEFWWKSICLLVDSHRYDYSDRDNYEKCLKILNRSIQIVQKEKSIRLNKLSTLAYVEASLFYDLAKITNEGISNGKLNEEELARRSRNAHRSSRRNSMHPTMFKRLSEVINLYETSFDIFYNNGFKRESVKCLKANSKLLKTFAEDCVNIEAKKDYFLQSLAKLKNCLEILNELLVEALSLKSPSEIQNISLPIHREVSDIKLEICEMMTDMLEIHLNGIKISNNKSSNKDNMTKVIEQYAGSEHDTLSDLDELWNQNILEIPDQLSVYLISCFYLNIKLKSFKCKTLYLLGRSYRIVSELKYQLRKKNLNDESNCLNMYSTISKWDSTIIELSKIYQLPSFPNDSDSSSKFKKPVRSNTALPGAQPLDSAENTDNNFNENEASINILSDADYIEESNLTNIADQELLKNVLIHVNQTEANSIDCLLQALSLALLNEDMETAAKVTYEIIELVGRFDVNLCSQFISLYQSLLTSVDAETLICKSSLNPKSSLLTGYFSLLNFYKNNNIQTNLLNSPIIRQILDLTKSKFNASKYLTVNSNHFNFIKDFPSNYTFLVLQHNQKKNEIFASILDNSKSGSKNMKQQIPNSAGQTKAAAFKVKTDPFELNYLLQQWKDWKTSLQSFNLKIEFQLNNDLIEKKTKSSQLAHSTNGFIKYYLDPSSARYDEMLQTMQDLENKFEFLLNSTEIYLKSVTDFVQKYFSENQTEPQMSSKTSTSIKPNEKLIILADMSLLEFPLESLKVFYDNQNLCSLSRDFSLQFFATRFFQPKEQAVPIKDEKKKDKPPKQNIVPPTNLEPLPEHVTLIDPLRVKYLIDVFNEASQGLPADMTPIVSFKQTCQQFSSVCSKWTGLTGLDHSPSLGECERYLTDSSCLLFNGTERFLSYFNSNKIASFNLNDCKLILANDLTQTNKSFGRITKDDVNRNAIELECENSLEANFLLSLTGVKCILSNQWTSNMIENTDKFINILKELMEKREACGEIVRYKVSPHLKFLLEEEKEEKKPAVEEKKEGKKTDKKEITTKKEEQKKKEAEPEVAKDSQEARYLQMNKEEKRLQILRNLSVVRKENLNMVCYGLPDVYLNIF